MELLQLRYFVTVVQEGSISAAARKLGMTQPPVSMQLRLLEKELGCTLLERGSRSIRLRDEGRVLYEHALRILSMSVSAASAVTDCHASDRGTLRIGVVSSLAELAVGRWFAGFSRLHPMVDFALTEGSTYELIDCLRSRQLDVALVRTPFSRRGLSCISLSPEDMLLIGMENHVAALPDPVPLRALAGVPLIVYRRWREVLDSAFAAVGCKPRFLCVADDARTCMAWAATGLGAAIAPADVCAVERPASLLTRVVSGLTPAAATTIATNEGGCDTAVGRAFVTYFLEVNGAG